MFAILDLDAQAVMQVVNSLGVELVIFAVTACFALAIRATSQPHSTSAKRIAKAKVVDPILSLAPKTSTPSRALVTAKATQSCTSTSSSEDEKVFDQRQQARRQPLKENRLLKQPREQQPWELIERITMLMRENSSQASAVQAVQLYMELRFSIGLDDEGNATSAVDIFLEATRRSKQNAGSFYVLLVQCAVRSKQCHLVDQLIKDMKMLKVSRTLFFYESAMKQLAGQKHYHLALSVYDHQCADGMEPSAVSCSCLIGFAAEVGENQRAVQFFKMLSEVTTPSIRAYMTVLRVHSKLQDWTASASVLQDMKARNVTVDSLALNVALATGIAADKLGEVEALLNEAVSADKSIADVVSYNTLIKGYSQRGESKAALRVKVRMDELGIKPTSVTFNTLMDALVRDKKVDEAWDLIQDMRRSGLKPDKFTCSILFKSLSKQASIQHIQSCLEILVEAKGNCDMKLQSTLYHTLIQVAAQRPDDVVLKQIVAQMRKENIELNDTATKILRERLRSIGRPS